MKRIGGLFLGLFLAVSVAAVPARACGCGGEAPPAPWKGKLYGAVALAVPLGIAGWLTYQNMRRRG